MALYLTNSLSGNKEVFTPIDQENIRLYVCGPTVYDRAHLGNARAMIVFDQLYRLLQAHFQPDKVTYVRNITDVDDKIIAAATEKKISIDALTKTTTQYFHEDMESLYCLPPTKEPKATTHIEAMVSLTEKILANNHGYIAGNHVLFDVTSMKNYGVLSKRKTEDLIAGARIDIEAYKKNPGDFVLWKPANESEPGWKTIWGRMRPGWHLECSAMSTEYLGSHFDIHGGGADLKFPHHENEIAQSCAAFNTELYANYWVHNGFLMVNGQKMSKSLGNYITVEDLHQQKLHSEIIRLILLHTHYTKPLDYTDKVVNDATQNMHHFYRQLDKSDHGSYEEFLDALSDDMNTPKALSIMHQSAGTTLKKMGELLGLLHVDTDTWFHTIDTKIDVEGLIKLRNQARIAKDWKKADEIRDELANHQIILEDKDGQTLWRKA